MDIRESLAFRVDWPLGSVGSWGLGFGPLCRGGSREEGEGHGEGVIGTYFFGG